MAAARAAVAQLFIEVFRGFVRLGGEHGVGIAQSPHVRFPVFHHSSAPALSPAGLVQIDQIQEGNGLPEQAAAQDAQDLVLFLENINLVVVDTVDQTGRRNVTVVAANGGKLFAAGQCDLHIHGHFLLSSVFRPL